MLNLRLEGNYQLATDNILDLSHIEFIHRESLARIFEKAAEEVVSTHEAGSAIWSCRAFKGGKVGEGGRGRGLPEGATFERWLDDSLERTRCHATDRRRYPGWCARASTAPTSQHTHIFTPESDRTCHYWFAVSESRKPGQETALQERVDRGIAELYRPFAGEDGPILAAQQEALGNAGFFESKPVFLAGDGAATRVRRRS